MFFRQEQNEAALRTGHRARFWITTLSLTLNVGLIAWLLRPATRPNSLQPAAKIPGAGISTHSQSAVPEMTAMTVQPNTAQPFSWSEIESTDYRQYINNLRAAGCPEQTIHDLILSEFNALYASRAQAIWKRPMRAYWQKARNNNNPGPNQVQALMALEREKTDILKDLLGTKLTQQAQIDTVYLQVVGDEQSVLFLPETKRQAALQALAGSGFEEREAMLRAQNPDSDPQTTLFEDKLKVLEEILSPTELNEFRLRNSPQAQWLRSEVQYFNCTVDEFQALLDGREEHLGTNEELRRDPRTALEDVRKILGEERAKEFERVSGQTYLNTRAAAERAGLSPELADRAADLTVAAAKEAQRLSGDLSLSADERQRQLQTLVELTENKLNAALGATAPASVRRNVRNAISMVADIHQ